MMATYSRYTVTFPDNLMQVLKDRADLNCRSLNKEIIFLLEGALASEIDGNLQIMRMLMAAQGGLPSGGTGEQVD